MEAAEECPGEYIFAPLRAWKNCEDQPRPPQTFEKLLYAPQGPLQNSPPRNTVISAPPIVDRTGRRVSSRSPWHPRGCLAVGHQTDTTTGALSLLLSNYVANGLDQLREEMDEIGHQI